MRAGAGQSRHALPDIGIASDPSHLLLVGSPTHNATLSPGKFSWFLFSTKTTYESMAVRGYWHRIGTGRALFQHPPNHRLGQLGGAVIIAA
jgi:hypothetical protein